DVIRNELRSRSLDSASFEVLEGMLFPPGHPYRRPAGESLQAATIEDARAFARAWYHPDRATVIASGDLDPAAVTGFFRDAFPETGTRVRQEPAAKPPKRYEAGPRRIPAPVSEA